MRHLAGLLTILMLILGSAAGDPLPPCTVIVNQLNPCVPFLTRNVATPSQTCCGGVRYLANYSSSKGDRISICQCIEGSQSMFPLIDFSLISNLPASCSVPITLPKITPTFDCSTV
ncbi:non-specific lipid-transfer protein A-like [Ricinus communis]|uniref:Non-specific lipid-transfer protein n=1 Tax=Ricinus communis TaxID=3988 RepID=B9RCS5_RICCO|nr:non-specific lipid-transfer protein A-like [Ricinus communis]EEF51346.1 Nonspecific lipid-transfer protein A, putative [Ricinus communis]|eukprot:XP_002509959.1 non-specific lipid-transfer protein A-like [Ricinus communis]